MSLKWKVVLLLSGVFGLFIGTAQIVQHFVVYPSFVALEGEEAVKQVDRCVDAITREVDHLSIFCADWAAWDDTYAYITDKNEAYEKSNFTSVLWSVNRLNLAYFYDTAGQVVWGEAHDLATMELLHLAEFSGETLDAGHPLLAHADPTSAVKGVLLTERGPMLVASRPIVTSENQGPIRGTVVMGRFLDESAVRALAERTRVPLALWSIGNDAVPPADRPVLRQLTAGTPLVCDGGDEAQALLAYATYPDIRGASALLLRAEVPKAISARGRSAMRTALISDVAAGAVILLLVWTALRVMVVGPLTKLMSHATRVGQQDDLTSQLDLPRHDEIGRLAREFNRMVKSLAESRKKLLDAAHRAGMAEIATDVLHNVGNALNTVNVSTARLGEKVQQSKVANLSKAVALLEQHRADVAGFLTTDERGRKLIEYLPKLAAALGDEQQQVLQETHALQDKVHHINQIIADQQTTAGGPQYAQPENPVAIIEEALRLRGALAAKHEITIERDFEPLPVILLNKLKLAQILDNLIKNGIESITATAGPQRRLTLRAKRQSAEWIGIEVCDTGVGIDQAHCPRLFQHGFTTKPDGHGFGLHFCANAMTELGGKIEIVSDGPGQGATVRLLLPVGPVRQTA
jgi:two-component system, NtrC family, sensor kinase